MARSERTVVVSRSILDDGQIQVTEKLEVWEGGFTTGTLVASGPNTGRLIDVGDDTSGEADDLIKDAINGNLHSAARKQARDDIKAAKQAERDARNPQPDP